MSRKTGPLLAALALGVSVASARADTPKATNLGQFIYKGRTEYLLNAAFRFNSPSSQDISFRIAPLVSERFQAGLDLAYHNDGGNSGSVGVVGNYFVGNLAHKTIPYIGVGVGTTFGDPGTHASYGVQGGIKHFLNEDVAATFVLQYRRMESMDWSG